MYTKTGKFFAELRLSFVNDRFLDRLFFERPWIRENYFYCLVQPSASYLRRIWKQGKVVLFSGSEADRQTQSVLHVPICGHE